MRHSTLRRFLAFLISFVTIAELVNGQTTSEKFPSVNIMSPNSSALGKYVEYPVNAYTGIPDISIPIYTLNEGPLSLPVSLSYHAGGMQVLETASWVGAGWSLNAGGMVGRTVKGLPDEKAGFENHSFYSNNGYSSYFMDESTYVDYKAFQDGIKDGEPDLFFFNFAGHNGKFFLREDGTPVMLPQSDYKIEIKKKSGDNSYNVHDYIQGFIIITPDGNRYHFGVTTSATDVDPIEKGGTLRGDGFTDYSTVITSWYLYKVESGDRKFNINLTYRSENYSYFTYSTSPCFSGSCDDAISVLKVFVNGVAVDEIRGTNAYLTFVPSTDSREDVGGTDGAYVEGVNTTAKKLAKITINSTKSTFCNSFELSYDYFLSAHSLPALIASKGTFVTDKKRLQLTSVRELSCDRTISKEPFIFSYYDKGNVPRRLSYAQDHWGFYNGALSNDNLVPSVNNGDQGGISASYNDDRDSHWPEMRAGALRSIQYPTGGGVEYVYEPNHADTQMCDFEATSTQVASNAAGMTTGLSDPGVSLEFYVPQTAAFSYHFRSASGGTGEFYIDNTLVTSVSSDESIQNFMTLGEGTHTIRCTANGDSGSGVGTVGIIYEANAICADVQKLVGGLRIKEIQLFGVENSPRQVKKYEYQQPRLYSVPVYIFKMRHELLAIPGFVPGGNGLGCKGDQISDGQTTRTYYQTFISPTSTHPLQTTQGGHIGYGLVKEIAPDGGYTITQYEGLPLFPAGWTTLEDVCVRRINQYVCSSSDPVYPTAPPRHDFTRGNLKSKAIFTSSGVKQHETMYSETYNGNAVGVFGLVTFPYPPSNTAFPTHFELKSAKIAQRKETQKLYNPSNPAEYLETVTVTEFGSVYHSMPTRVIKQVQGVSDEQRTSYIQDLTACNASCTTCENNFISKVEEVKALYESNKTNVCSTVGWPKTPECDQLIGCDAAYTKCGYRCPDNETTNCAIDDCFICAWTDFQYRLNEARKTYTSCLINCSANKKACVENGMASTTGKVNDIYSMESENQLASPVEFSTWKNDELLSSTYFEYNQEGTNSFENYLKNIYKLQLNTPSTTFAAVTLNTTSGPVKDNRYNSGAETSYRYEGGQIVEVVAKNGLITSYIWMHGSSVPIIKAVGVNYTTLLTAYNEAGMNLRTHPSIANVEVTTYALDPAVGILSITDANGKIQRYEYDKVGRLTMIKDTNGNILEQFEYTYQH